MSQFPNRVPLASTIDGARRERRKRIIYTVLIATLLRLFIIAAEFIGVLFSGSASLLTDALFSLVDVAFSLFLIVCVVLAGRPPDEEHPFGHGRYEPLIGLQSGLFMFLLGAGMAVQQLFEFTHGIPNRSLEHPIWLIPLAAVILLEIAYQCTMRTARKQNSTALAADAVHYRVDSLTSLFALVALLSANFIPAWSDSIDHLGAVAISVLMLCLGLFAAKQNLNQLLDHIPDKQFFDRVTQAARSVSGVRGVEKTRIQLYGPDAHVDIDIEVDPLMSVDASHRIAQQVRSEIQHAWNLVRDVTVHIEPYYPGDHT